MHDVHELRSLAVHDAHPDKHWKQVFSASKTYPYLQLRQEELEAYD